MGGGCQRSSGADRLTAGSGANTAVNAPIGQQGGQCGQGGRVATAQLRARELARSQLAITCVGGSAQPQPCAAQAQPSAGRGHVCAGTGAHALQAQQAGGHGCIRAGCAQQGGARWAGSQAGQAGHAGHAEAEGQRRRGGRAAGRGWQAGQGGK